MITEAPFWADDSSHSRAVPIDDSARLGLGHLQQAYLCAQNSGTELWDFALEIGWLFDKGLTINHLRWLVAKRFAEHAQESSVYGDSHRSFLRGDGFFFDHKTCVVLTSAGAAFVSQFMKNPVLSLQTVQPLEPSPLAGPEFANQKKVIVVDTPPNGTTPVPIKPCWNKRVRELKIIDKVVKRFRVPAHNQEIILSAFEEEGWPEHIDDPLPVRMDINPQTRLHDAINRLNGCQTHRLIRFTGNGTGTGICWKLR